MSIGAWFHSTFKSKRLKRYELECQIDQLRHDIIMARLRRGYYKRKTEAPVPIITRREFGEYVGQERRKAPPQEQQEQQERYVEQPIVLWPKQNNMSN